jgi:hypothetical protein
MLGLICLNVKQNVKLKVKVRNASLAPAGLITDFTITARLSYTYKGIPQCSVLTSCIAPGESHTFSFEGDGKDMEDIEYSFHVAELNTVFGLTNDSVGAGSYVACWHVNSETDFSIQTLPSHPLWLVKGG